MTEAGHSGATNTRTDEIRVYGRAASAAGYKICDFLSRSVVEFEWIEVEDDAQAIRQLGMDGLDDSRLPVCVLPDGQRIEAATVRGLATRLGWITKPRAAEYDVSIYGAGPAGLSAAVYAASEGLRTVLLEREAVGGQAGTSSLIENYMGFPGGVSGAHLAERARQQAVAFGAEILLLHEGIKAEFREGKIFVNLADGGKMVARTNICATGVEYRRLGLQGEDHLVGAGVYYGAAASEAPMCADEEVYVVGGGNSAVQAIMHLSEHARRVTVLVRGEGPAASMSHYLLERLQATPNVEIQSHRSITAVEGEDHLESVTIRDARDGSECKVDTQHLFVLIGGRPHTEWAKDTTIVRDPTGYLVTGPDLLDRGKPPAEWPLERPPHYLETSVPGSFAAGDVRHGSVKRVASAVGEGAMAVQFVHRHLNES